MRGSSVYWKRSLDTESLLMIFRQGIDFSIGARYVDSHGVRNKGDYLQMAGNEPGA